VNRFLEINVNASHMVPGECRDQIDRGGREERRKRPSDLPTTKGRRRHVEGCGGDEEPSA